jgi:hypothetical protein
MPWLNSFRCATGTLLALALLAAFGCEKPTPVPSGITPKEPERIVESPASPTGIAETPVAVAPLVEPDDGGRLVEETWDAYSIQGSRVGYAHTTIAEVEEQGQKLVRTRSAMRVLLKRAGQAVAQDIVATSWELPSGELVRLESRMTTGPGQIIATGQVAEGELQLSVNTVGKTESSEIPWQADWGGYFAVEQSLRKLPLQPGEKRTIRALQPVINVPADVELAAADFETVKLPSGEAKLLRIKASLKLPNGAIETTYWVDDRGDPLKSQVPSLQQEAVRTTKEDALWIGGQAFDLLVASIAKLKGELPNPLGTKRVVYRARLTSGKIEGIFANCLSQRVKVVDDQTAEITVLAVRPNQPETPDLQPNQPTDEDLAPNNLIQSDDELVRLMAGQAANDRDAWAVSMALEKFVNQAIRKKNFSQAFATAGEVARSLEGDCTEHAVLLAALLRARKIPARVAFGLVYYPPQRGFAYHMWTEAWTGDRWVPLDGTLGGGGIGADHIKLADSSLKGASALTAMLPVVQVLGRLELEVVSVE